MPQATARLIIKIFKETGRVFEKKSDTQMRKDEKTEIIQSYIERLAACQKMLEKPVSELAQPALQVASVSEQSRC